MQRSMSLIALALVCQSTAALSQTQSSPSAKVPTPAQAPPYGSPITLKVAQLLIARAVKVADARGWRLAIAIVEPSGELVAFGRMDDTQYGSIFVAQQKARTSARYRLPSALLEERVAAGRLVILANSDYFPFPGGLPIKIDGRIVGAIGVSGATSAEDEEVALAALASIEDD